jgi:hypothetical protein
MMRARLFGIAALLVSGSLLATTGCLGGGAQTRFYVLAPLAGPVATAADSRSVTIGVGPVRLPGYVDRAPLVTRRGAEEIDVADLDRWGEPLADGVPRIIADNLAALMPAARIALFPWSGSRAPQYQVVVEVARFDGPLGGALVLDARWRVIGSDRRDPSEHRFSVAEPTGAPTYPALVAAMSRALDGLSREIAGVLKTL